MRNLILGLCLLFTTSIVAQNPQPIECGPVWQQNILGNYIGSTGMYVGDYNNNGRDELILGNQHVMNIMEYVPEYNSYEIIWSSKAYDALQKLIIADSDNDGTAEILIYHDDYYIDLYDLTSLEITDTYRTNNSFWFYSDNMFVADADNDGLNELVIVQYDITALYRIINGTCTKLFEMNDDGHDAKCGDIDGDGINELVFNSGNVYRIENGQPELIWTIPNIEHYSFVELADIDNDSIVEIFIEGWSLEVYDGDTQQRKWRVFGCDPVAFTVANIDSIGLPEIIYIEKDWGSVYCLDALDGSVRWSVHKEEFGASNIVIGDPDDDGNLEMIYGSEGYSFAEPDHLHIVQIHDLSKEYISVNDRGQYHAFKIADIDNDSRNELITLSRSSELFGTGIITVYDAETKHLEWRSTDSLIPVNNSHGMLTMETADIDNDGDLEIVIPCSNDGDPALIYINGRTHVVDTVKTWNFNSYQQSPHDMVINDLDSDGILEIITVTQDSLWIINSQTLERIKSITHTFGSFIKSVTGNVDNDPNIELIYVNQDLYVVDGVTGETWVAGQLGDLNNCFLYDYNLDGISDIIASTIQGTIYYINGITHESETLTQLFFPYSLQFIDFPGVTGPVIFYTNGRNIYLRRSDGSTMFTEFISDITNYTLASKITDYNNDGHAELFFGTDFYMQQWDLECYSCESFTVNHESHNASCYAPDGSIEIIPHGGQEPYTFIWNTGDTTAMISEKAAGMYNVFVTDKKDCSLSLQFEIGLDEFTIDSITTTPDDISTTACEGNAVFHTTSGTPPYSILIDDQWITLSDSTFSGLCKGNHQLSFKDVNGCLTIANVTIESVLGFPEINPSMQFSIIPNPANGSAWLQITQVINEPTVATISTIQGITLEKIEITTQRTHLNLTQLPKGIYLLTLSNTSGRNTKKLIVE